MVENPKRVGNGGGNLRCLVGYIGFPLSLRSTTEDTRVIQVGFGRYVGRIEVPLWTLLAAKYTLHGQVIVNGHKVGSLWLVPPFQSMYSQWFMLYNEL